MRAICQALSLFMSAVESGLLFHPLQRPSRVLDEQFLDSVWQSGHGLPPAEDAQVWKRCAPSLAPFCFSFPFPSPGLPCPGLTRAFAYG